MVDDSVADGYFATRTAPRRLGLGFSSSVLSSRDLLEKSIDSLEEKFAIN